MADKIQIFDTTLRDGEQVPGCQLKTDEKLMVARELEALGVDVIEAGFPISSPGDFLSVVEISKAVKEPVVCGLTRAKKEDIDVAAEALHHAKRGRIHTGIGASDVHIKHKFRSTREQVLEQGVWAVQYAKSKGYEVEFYAEDAGRADLPFLAQLIESVIAAGADVVNIPDTTGYCKTHKDLNLYTNIKSERIFEISNLVSELMHMPVQPNKAIVGRNAFAHSSGIHQDGFLKHAENYEIINPADVGVPSSSIVLTARSGRAALRHRVEQLGYHVQGEELNQLYENFLLVADEKGNVENDDLHVLMANQAVLAR
jgi:isopropylmalate/homocitrate/citramalate synthase